MKQAIADGRPNTAALWRKFWPEAPRSTNAVRCTLLQIARNVAESDLVAGDTLVGSHEFVAVAVASDPTLAIHDPNIACLGEADIIRYDIEVEGLDARITGWEVLPAP